MYRFLSEFTGLPEEQVEMECGECRFLLSAVLQFVLAADHSPEVEMERVECPIEPSSSCEGQRHVPRQCTAVLPAAACAAGAACPPDNHA